MKRLASIASVSLSLSLVCLSGAAFAQSAEDKATAQSLFDRGLKLLETKSYDEACPLLAESHRLDPAQGTLFRLATCLEGQGKIAGAWAAYTEVAEAAKASKQPDRERVARQKAAALQAKLAFLTVKAADADAEIKRDGSVLSRALRGQEIPVDPGAHKISATRDGHTPFETSVTLGSGEHKTVDVPALTKAAGAPPPATAGTVAPPPATSAAPPSTAAPITPPPPPEPNGLGTTRKIALASGGVGVLGLVGAGVFGLMAKSKRDDSSAHCTGNLCDPTGLEQRDAALSRATVSTVLGVVGVVGVGAGAALWIVGKPSSASVGTDGQRLLVGGTF